MSTINKSKAYREGLKDGLAWDLDGEDPQTVRPWSWVTATIHALGPTACARLWEIDPGDADAWEQACDDYGAGCSAGATAPQEARTRTLPCRW